MLRFYHKPIVIDPDDVAREIDFTDGFQQRTAVIISFYTCESARPDSAFF